MLHRLTGERSVVGKENVAGRLLSMSFGHSIATFPGDASTSLYESVCVRRTNSQSRVAAMILFI